VLETPEVESEYGWKHLDKDLLARITQARRANLHWLRL
jgi:hypothetical protein